MRGWLVCSILVASMASGPSPFVEAREMSDHLAPAMTARPAAIPHMEGDRLADRDRMDRDRLGRHRRHFSGFFPFWFDEGFVGYPGPETVALGPPDVASDSRAPSVPDADRPPCHEVTGAGVVIDRGLGCRHAGQ